VAATFFSTASLGCAFDAHASVVSLGVARDVNARGRGDVNKVAFARAKSTGATGIPRTGCLFCVTTGLQHVDEALEAACTVNGNPGIEGIACLITLDDAELTHLNATGVKTLFKG